NATKTTWSPVATGNVIIMGVDNANHAYYGYNASGADRLVKRGVAFAVGNTNRTGLYYSMSCFYSLAGPTPVPHLSLFGNFTVRGYGFICLDDVHIVATHPIFTNAPALTDTNLSGW